MEQRAIVGIGILVTEMLNHLRIREAFKKRVKLGKQSKPPCPPPPTVSQNGLPGYINFKDGPQVKYFHFYQKLVLKTRKYAEF